MLKTGESATVIIAHTGVTGGAAAVLSLTTAEGGRLAMVAARYIEERYLNPLREKRIKREEEAKKEIREEGRKQGSAEAHARWETWNERRLAAKAKGEPFDEPTPATLRNRGPVAGGAWPGRRATLRGCGDLQDRPTVGVGLTGRHPLWTQLTSDPCTATHDVPIMGRMNT